MNDASLLAARVKELSLRAYEGDFLTHTAFLSASGQAEFLDVVRREGGSVYYDSGTAGPFVERRPEQEETFIKRESQRRPFLDRDDSTAARRTADLRGSAFGTLNGAPYVIFGGWEDAERTVVSFLPSYLDRETFLKEEMASGQVISCIEAKPLNVRYSDELTHRDWLGALMNLGIERDRVGDILVGNLQEAQGRSYYFVLKENAEIICRELTRVRHTTVTCREVPPTDCDIRPAFEEWEGFVASERLDAVIAMVWHLSRGKAQELVQQELVIVDGRTAFSGGYDVKPGSRVSVRGYGKFRYLGAEGAGRKGRLHVKVQVYR